MKPQKKAFQILILLEAAALAAVLLYGILQTGTTGWAKNKRPGEAPALEKEHEIGNGLSVGIQETGADGQAGGAPGGAAGNGQTSGNQEGTAGNGQTSGNQEGTDGNGQASGAPGEAGEDNSPGPTLPAPEFSPEVKEKLAALTLEEKIAQMFLITPEALTHNDVVNIAKSGTREAINACPVGGLCYAAKNFQGKEQTKAMLEGVQGYSMERIGLPLFLAVEEIGGNQNSPLAVENNYALQASPAVTGAGGDPEKAREAGEAIAGYLTAEGFNLNLMPVACLSEDLAEGQQSKSYGARTADVAMMLSESVTALRDGGIGTAVGCFPWKGEAPACPKGLETWQDTDALAHGAAINAGTDLMMLSNASFGALTGEGETPCSLSEGAVAYLRGPMGYTGML